MKHRKVLLSDEVKQRFQLNERDIASAATLPELDEAYTRRVHNFSSVSEMYEWSSSIHYIPSIKHSMIYINSKDDPIVPEELLTSIRDHSSKLPSQQSFVFLMKKKQQQHWATQTRM